MRDLLKLEEPRLAQEREEAAHHSALRRYYEKLESKYRRAAFLPWRSFDADPPRPE
jgi:hypothetical protein